MGCGLVDYLVPGFVGVEFGDGARVLSGFGARKTRVYPAL
jgi:hypothetical protein